MLKLVKTRICLMMCRRVVDSSCVVGSYVQRDCRKKLSTYWEKDQIWYRIEYILNKLGYVYVLNSDLY
jgi:hypothetical protein